MEQDTLKSRQVLGVVLLEKHQNLCLCYQVPVVTVETQFDLFYLLNKAELSKPASSHGGSHHQGHRELSCPPLFSEAVSKLLLLNFIKLFTIIMNGCVARVSTWLAHL